MTDIATLGIKVDSTPAAKAAKDLDTLAGAAQRAETATEQVTQSFRMSGTATAQFVAGQRAAVTAITQTAAATAQVTSRTSLWQRTVQGLSSLYNAVTAAVQRATAALMRHKQVVVDTPAVPNTGSTLLPVANLAAQFQDVGVTSAMGMNPLQIALQQGTQISAVLGPMGAAGAVRALGAAFTSIITPVSLFTIGIVAVVAAGLQMVNWTAVAKTTLNGVASVLQAIAPYAVAVAGAIALLYAPAIISGIGLTVIWLGRLAVSAVTAAVALAAANPGMAIVLGITAAVAAMVIFRDQLKQIFGRDIVEDAKGAANWLIGTFVGAFDAVKAVWSALPAVIGDVAISVANQVIGAIESMINGAVDLLNGLIDKANGIPGVNIGKLGHSAIGRINNPFAGEAEKASAQIGKAIDEAQKTDYIGNFVVAVGSAASTAAAKLRDLASGLGDADKNGAKLAKRYAEIVQNAHQFIAEQEMERRTIGLTDEAANRLRYEQDLLNRAQDAGIKLTGAQRAELGMLASQMASTEATTSKLRAAFDFVKDTTKGFFTDFKQGLEDGAGLWQSFANAAVGALNKIADKLLDMALDQAINGLLGKLFGSFFGGASGGFATGLSGGMGAFMGGLYAKGGVFANGNVIPFAQGGVVGGPTFFPMSGGRTGMMGENGEEGIFPLRRTASGHLGVIGTSGGALTINIDARGAAAGVGAEIETAIDNAIDRYDRFQAPRTIARHKNTTMLETGATTRAA